MNIPNALTLLRIFFVPLLVAALVQEDLRFQIGGAVLTNEILALVIFLAAGFTDFIDGYLARRWGQITTVGMLLDPIADKLLVSSALIALVQVNRVPAWVAILIVAREFAVSGLRSIAASEGYTIQASELGKSKMMAQVAAVSLVMIADDLPVLQPAVRWILWGVVVLTIYSALDYFHKFWHAVDERVKARRRIELLQLERDALAQRAGKVEK